jgi:hypothetical protein
MTLKYRVQKIEIPGESTVFVAQYRILGIWMNIGMTRGHFHKECDTQCGTILEAYERVKKHKELLGRSGKWAEKKITNINI